ncbi:DUF6907 domain-containing protein [Streptomyces sp. NPDC050421]|uniref:DUF6907 domain-containing protein n=1 Tax=Streptomyces sp. NPDC050421 TaxID=3365613 RepID=UPI0037B0E7F5
MTAARTVTVPTLVINVVDATVPEPAWCRGHEDLPANALVDLGHRGIEHHLGTAEHPVFVAQLSQYPHGSGPHDVRLYVEAVSEPDSLTPAEAEHLAAALVEAAVQLRTLALQLAVLRAEDGAQ